MGYANFLLMKEEISLVAVIVILLIYDIFGTPKKPEVFSTDSLYSRGYSYPAEYLAQPGRDSFRGMYHSTAMGGVMKSILSIGTLLVFMQANNWLSSERAIIRRGEFYMITLATLLGMYFMISAGNFLMFFIGLETASIPMATLAAFDKYKQQSAEAGAKYILTAVFASGLSLYGISLIYGTTERCISRTSPPG